jgi:hypothetical protein
MQVKFTTAQPMDFTNVQYVVMFNTSTSGGMPYANGYQTNYANYSFALVVGGNGTTSSVQVIQYVRNTGVGGGQVASPVNLPYTPQQLQANLNSNGQNTQFTITFDRRLFNGIVATPSPVPGANPNLWYINWFTTNGSGQPIDAPGLGGPQDQTFTFPTTGLPGSDISTSFDQQFSANAGWPQVTSRSAQIAAGEVINAP